MCIRDSCSSTALRSPSTSCRLHASPPAPRVARRRRSRSWSISMNEADESLARLLDELGGLGSACVAFSGGVDSSLVLAAAVRALGTERVVAFTAVSPTYLPEELVAARRVTRELGVAHEVVETHEFDDPGYTSNPRDRCYRCKAGPVSYTHLTLPTILRV